MTAEENTGMVLGFNSGRQYTQVYNAARWGLIHLGADDAVLSHYQLLKKTDLKVNTTIATPNTPGQCKAQLAWFWNIENQQDANSDDWMEEGKF